MSGHPVQVLTLQLKFGQRSVMCLRHRFSFGLRYHEANFLTFVCKEIKGFLHAGGGIPPSGLEDNIVSITNVLCLSWVWKGGLGVHKDAKQGWAYDFSMRRPVL